MANDADGRRCSMLAHHSRRMRSPAFIITHHDATTLPMLPAEDGKTSTGFDRILCDVPCTGDGTMRKAPHLWKKWSPAGGIGLHPLQLRIALRAARLLRVGGDMCYSTCSLNPLENEAVVAELVRCCGGSLQIVDVSDRLPELQRWPGLTEWRVLHPRSPPHIPAYQPPHHISLPYPRPPCCPHIPPYTHVLYLYAWTDRITGQTSPTPLYPPRS